MTAPVQTNASEELLRTFSCKICFEPYSRKTRYPVSLHCGHSFCAVCVLNLAKDEPFIRCGICRRVHFSKYQLCKNITLTNLLEYSNLLVDDDEPDNETATDAKGADQEEESKSQFIRPTHLIDFCTQLKLLQDVIPTLPEGNRSECTETISHMNCSISEVEIELNSATEKFLQLNRDLARLCEQIYQQVLESYQPADGLDNDMPAEFDDFVIPPVLSTPPLGRRSGFRFTSSDISSLSLEPSSRTTSLSINASDFWENGWTEDVGNWDAVTDAVQDGTVDPSQQQVAGSSNMAQWNSNDGQQERWSSAVDGWSEESGSAVSINMAQWNNERLQQQTRSVFLHADNRLLNSNREPMLRQRRGNNGGGGRRINNTSVLVTRNGKSSNFNSNRR